MPETPGAVLAFDFGPKYTGVAVGVTGNGICRPLETIRCTTRAARWQAVERLLKEWAPVRLVVGLPLDASGSEQVSTRQCRNFAAELTTRYGLPTTLVDERFTSLEADALLRERGYSRQQRAEAEHAEAAALILKSYLSAGHP